MIFGKATKPKVFGKWTKNSYNFERPQVPYDRTDINFLAEFIIYLKSLIINLSVPTKSRGAYYFLSIYVLYKAEIFKLKWSVLRTKIHERQNNMLKI